MAGYPVVVEIPVAWGEMDAFGHVNNIDLLPLYETARIAYFEKLDVPEFLGRDPVGPDPVRDDPAVSARRCAYPDTVSVGGRSRRPSARIVS